MTRQAASENRWGQVQQCPCNTPEPWMLHQIAQLERNPAKGLGINVLFGDTILAGPLIGADLREAWWDRVSVIGPTQPSLCEMQNLGPIHLGGLQLPKCPLRETKRAVGNQAGVSR